MSTITISLIETKHAPWGLLTETHPPQVLIWLTEYEPVGHVDKRMLHQSDLLRIEQSRAAGIIEVSGIEVPKPPPKEVIPISAPEKPKVAPSETIVDVTTLMREEARQAKKLKERVQKKSPKVEELLAMSANKLKKELKVLAKGMTPPSFFQSCRAKEVEGKNRKTVIAVLVEIIQSKIAAVGVEANTYRNATQLSEAYYDMIEEFEDEEEEVEIKTVSTPQ